MSHDILKSIDDNMNSIFKLSSIYTERKKKRIFTLNNMCINDILFL